MAVGDPAPVPSTVPPLHEELSRGQEHIPLEFLASRAIYEPQYGRCDT